MSIRRLGWLTSWPASPHTRPIGLMSCCRGIGGRVPRPTARRPETAVIRASPQLKPTAMTYPAVFTACLPQTDGRQATKVAIAADVLNRMLELGRPEYVRIAYPRTGVGLNAPTPPIHTTR